jgi:hypothetical protein
MPPNEMQSWLSCGKPAWIAGKCLRPKPHPYLPGELLEIKRGQAGVYPLSPDEKSESCHQDATGLGNVKPKMASECFVA